MCVLSKYGICKHMVTGFAKPKTLLEPWRKNLGYLLELLSLCRGS